MHLHAVSKVDACEDPDLEVPAGGEAVHLEPVGPRPEEEADVGAEDDVGEAPRLEVEEGPGVPPRGEVEAEFEAVSLAVAS